MRQLGPRQPRRQAACGRKRCHRRQYSSETPSRGEGSLRRCGEEPRGCDLVVVVMMLEKGGNAAEARNNLDLRWEPNRSSQLLSFADRDTPLQKPRVRCKYKVLGTSTLCSSQAPFSARVGLWLRLML